MSKIRRMLMTLISAVSYIIDIPIFQSTNTNNRIDMVLSSDPLFTTGNSFNITFDYYIKMYKAEAGNSYARVTVVNGRAFTHTAVLIRGATTAGTYEWSGQVNTVVAASKLGPGIQMQTQADGSTCEFTIANLKIRKIS